MLNMFLYSAFREFLVDLMADPGTLIPADIPNAKDTTFKPYTQNISRIPLNNYGVAHSAQKPFQGESSGQNTTVESSLVMDRRPKPENAESPPAISGSNVDNGVGTSRLPSKVTPSNDFDHLASSAIGNTHYKGIRGTNAVDGGVRMNVNVVPYNQNQEDPKNLFADLNPFHIKGPGKNSPYNKPTENKIGDLQRLKNNLSPGRPPVPLMWKSRYAQNEVPMRKESDRVEGILPRAKREPNDYNSSSLACTSTSSSEKNNDVSFRSPGNANLSSKESGEKNNRLDFLPKSTSELGNMTLADDRNTEYRGEHIGDPKGLQSDRIYMEDDKNEIGPNGHRKVLNDSSRESNLKLKDPQSLSPSVYPGRNRFDQVFDDVDVGECEIPWEDLVLSDRIGIGNM